MNSIEDKIDAIKNLIDGCFLPEFQKDFGEIYLNTEHFNDFRQNVDIGLIQLFDLIQQNEAILYNIEKETLELRYKLLLLLLEQSAADTIYGTQNKYFLKNLDCLIDKHFIKILNQDRQVFEKIDNYYKNLLNPNSWKRNIGAVHGFMKFCELFYEKNSRELDSKAVTFILSVGLLLREFYEPSYKQLGYKLFYIILKQTPRDVILEINIQNVIYDAVFQDLKKIDTEQGIKYIAYCLLNCLTFFKTVDFHKWNQVDDLINEVVRRLTYAPSIKICSILLLFLGKINLQFSGNRHEIEFYANEENLSMCRENLKSFREECSKINSVVPYRWAKKFLQLLIAESNYLMGNTKASQDLLLVMYVFYLICIYPIPANVLDTHLKEFFNKFALILMEVLRVNKNELDTVKIVKDWFETFKNQISEYKSKDNDFFKYCETFENIIEDDVFGGNEVMNCE